MDGISRSEVSRICKVLDEHVKTLLAVRSRGRPCVWLDATFHKIPEGGRVIQVGTVVAGGIFDARHRRALAVDTGHSEDP
jgi:putative transposase